ncbi:MAG: YfbK domain-containing protein [Alistipes onderdonkii]
MHDEDFNDDTRDAGESAPDTASRPLRDRSRSGRAPFRAASIRSNTVRLAAGRSSKPRRNRSLTVKIRYKARRRGQPQNRTGIHRPRRRRRLSDFRFASAAAMFGQLLRDSDQGRPPTAT